LQQLPTAATTPNHPALPDHAAAIEASLALAVERAGDPQALIYDRLFARHPAMQKEFWRDTSGSIRGEMLNRTLEVAHDLAGGNGVAGGSWAPSFLETEIVTHSAYGIPPAVFGDFLPIVATIIQAGAGGASILFPYLEASNPGLASALRDQYMGAVDGQSGAISLTLGEGLLPPNDDGVTGLSVAVPIGQQFRLNSGLDGDGARAVPEPATWLMLVA
jgi:hypothetical protein